MPSADVTAEAPDQKPQEQHRELRDEPDVGDSASEKRNAELLQASTGAASIARRFVEHLASKSQNSNDIKIFEGDLDKDDQSSITIDKPQHRTIPNEAN